MKKTISILLSLSMLICALPNVVFAAQSATMTVDNKSVINTVTDKLYGLSTDWSINNPIAEPNSSKTAVVTNQNFVRAMNEYKLPLVRIGEGATSSFDWEKAIGDYASRPNQTIWDITGKVAVGPIEYVNVFETIDPNVSFSFTLDVMNSNYAVKAAHFAEFLTGGEDTEYGQKRIAQGHPDPINVVLYELGNEPDWFDASPLTVDEYIKRCKEIIAAVRQVNPKAVFSADVSTLLYRSVAWTSMNYDSEAAWHRKILADSNLMQYISYLSLHAYYDFNDSLMETLVTKLENDIKNSSFPNTKIYLSEHALNYYDSDGDGTKDTNPASMGGVIETSFTYQRLMAHNSVELVSYHGIYSSAWKNIWKASSGEMQMNAIGNLLKLYKEYGTGDVLSSSYSGFNVSSDSSANGVAVRDSKGNVKLIFTNNTADSQNVSVSLNNVTCDYSMVRETRIVSTGGTGSEITETSNGVAVNTYEYADGAVFNSYSVPAYSVCAVKLSPTTLVKQTKNISYEGNFKGIIDGVMPEGYDTVTGRTLSYASGGTLIVKATENTPSYVKIGNLSNLRKEGLAIEADVTLISEDAAAKANGVKTQAGFAFLSGASSSTGGLLTYTNQAEFAENGSSVLCSSIAYESGKEFSAKKPVKLRLAFNNASKSPDIYVNGLKYTYSNLTSSNTSDGMACLMVLGATVKFDNIKVTQDVIIKSGDDPGTVQKTETFTYEQNFNGVTDGSLPSGWKLYPRNDTAAAASKTSASVKGGALSLTNTNWFGNEWLLFDGMDGIARKGLTMECDITYCTSASNPGGEADAKAGFAYMAKPEVSASGVNNVKGDYLTLFTDQSNPECQKIHLAGTKTDGRTWEFPIDASGVTAINANGNKAVHLKAVFENENYAPIIYIDDKQVEYDRGKTMSAQYYTTGKVGFYIKNANVLIDNFKVTGSRVTEIPNVRSHEASFRHQCEKYDSVEAAINDVKLSVYDAEGNYEGDATAASEITYAKSDNKLTITVSYEGKSYTLNCLINDYADRTFVYEENFETVADGALPLGWNVYERQGYTGKTTAYVSDGALYFTNTNWYGEEWLLFEDIPDIARKGLTMECDITYQTSKSNSGAESVAKAGFACVTDVKAGTDGDYATGDYITLFTDLENPSCQKLYMGGLKTDGRTWYHELDAEGIAAINANNNQPVHFKVSFETNQHGPNIYINGTQVAWDRGTIYSGQYKTNGKVGFFIRNASVKIDNVKISGTKTTQAVYENYLTMGDVSYDSANKSLSIPVSAGLADTKSAAASSALIAAVYDNNDRLKTAKVIDVDPAKFADYHGLVTVEGVDAAPSANEVKLFFWDMANISPYAPSAEK